MHGCPPSESFACHLRHCAPYPGALSRTLAETGLELSAFFVGPECRSTWKRRAAQVELDPGEAAWVTGIVVDAETNLPIGRAGFHASPDSEGRVEVGYAIDPDFRGRGFGRAALFALAERARREPRVRVVRASVAPDNEASLKLVRGFGFVQTGSQIDEEDGLELIFEMKR